MKRIRFFIYAVFLWPVSLWAQDVSLLLKQAANAEMAMQDELAYLKYQEVLKYQPNNITVLCKCSELACKIGHRQSTKEEQIRHFEIGQQYAQLALKINPSHSDANFVMSLAMGRMALVATGRKQVEAVKAIKVYADKTIMLNPSDFRGYHVLGKWYFEISNLGAFKRNAVKLFYGAFPDASFDDSRRSYQKSMLLNPGFNLNYLELAKVYVKLEKVPEAIIYLEKLKVLPLKLEDDQRIHSEGKKMLKELKASL